MLRYFARLPPSSISISTPHALPSREIVLFSRSPQELGQHECGGPKWPPKQLGATGMVWRSCSERVQQGKDSLLCSDVFVPIRNAQKWR
jgi:hypothetical protein